MVCYVTHICPSARLADQKAQQAWLYVPSSLLVALKLILQNLIIRARRTELWPLKGTHQEAQTEYYAKRCVSQLMYL